MIWVAFGVALVVPVAFAFASPLLAWRDPIYVGAGFAGVIAIALLLIQPVLASGVLPGVSALRWRRLHRLFGGLLVVAVIAHVAGLWITSPPDVVDALMFVSPTPFSAWGVLAMWAIFGTALLAVLRRPLRLRWQVWQLCHATLAVVIVSGSVVHGILIEGTMETVSKTVLCALVIAATIKAISGLKVFTGRAR